LAFGKSVSLTGSIFVGWQLAILVYQLLLPQGTGILNVVLGLAGALSMTVVGLVVENLFRIPADRESDEA
jgi:ABC-type sugar transport system permease subunit